MKNLYEDGLGGFGAFDTMGEDVDPDLSLLRRHSNSLSIGRNLADRGLAHHRLVGGRSVKSVSDYNQGQVKHIALALNALDDSKKHVGVNPSAYASARKNYHKLAGAYYRTMLNDYPEHDSKEDWEMAERHHLQRVRNLTV